MSTTNPPNMNSKLLRKVDELDTLHKIWCHQEFEQKKTFLYVICSVFCLMNFTNSLFNCRFGSGIELHFLSLILSVFVFHQYHLKICYARCKEIRIPPPDFKNHQVLVEVFVDWVYGRVLSTVSPFPANMKDKFSGSGRTSTSYFCTPWILPFHNFTLPGPNVSMIIFWSFLLWKWFQYSFDVLAWNHSILVSVPEC